MGKKMIFITFLAVLLLVSVHDIRKKRIPDGCLVLLLLLTLAAMIVMPEPALGDRVLGCVCVSFPMLGISLLRPGAFGGGDIKLMAVGGLFLGWGGIVLAATVAVFLAGAYCAAGLLRGKLDRKSAIAFGPFLCLGMVTAVMKMIWM